MSHAAFRAAIRENPSDDTARLVYADWLEENGDPDRAEFIRAQVELARLDETDPSRPALEDRENELLRANEAAWLGPVPAALTGWKFDRGFPAEIAGDTRALTAGGVAALFDRHPVTRLRINQTSAGESPPVQRLLSARWLPRIRGLIIDNFQLDADGMPRLLGSDRLSNLHRLELTRVSRLREGEDLPGLLASSPAFRGVTAFRLASWNGSGEELGKVLAASAVDDLHLDAASVDLGTLLAGGFAGRLRRLELAGVSPEAWGPITNRRTRPGITHLGLTGLNQDGIDPTELLESPACGRLVALDMNEARVRAEAVRAVAATDFWRRCRELRLIRGQCPPAVMARLARDPGPENLRVLKLGETGLRDEGVRQLCSAPWAASLVELDIMRNFLTDDACRAIRDSGPFARLRHLDIRTNGPKLSTTAAERITDAGLEALAAAPCLSRLRHLNMHSLPVTARGVDAVINGPHWKLAELDVGGTDIGPDGIRVLAASPNLARLTRLNLSFITNLKEEDLLPLAESPYLSPVCEVSGLYYRLSARVKSALQERLGRRLRV